VTDDLVLRPAVDADSEPIALLWHAGWRDGHLGHVPDALLAHRDEDSFRERVPARLPHTTVAEVDGRVVGFVTVLGDELEQVYVAADARGTGVAGRLMEHGERVVAAEHEVAWLAVASGNARARRFYERSGWRDTGEIDYEAETADGTFLVPCQRYEKSVRA
jgi:ribosomal protein S18 acetylase RimI-like enzyme